VEELTWSSYHAGLLGSLCLLVALRHVPASQGLSGPLSEHPTLQGCSRLQEGIHDSSRSTLCLATQFLRCAWLLTNWRSGFGRTSRMLVGVLLGSFCVDIFCSASGSSRVRVRSDPTEWRQPFVEPSFISWSVERHKWVMSRCCCNRDYHQIYWTRERSHYLLLTSHRVVSAFKLSTSWVGISGLHDIAEYEINWEYILHKWVVELLQK
jgi:hypothetical protein